MIHVYTLTIIVISNQFVILLFDCIILFLYTYNTIHTTILHDLPNTFDTKVIDGPDFFFTFYFYYFILHFVTSLK